MSIFEKSDIVTLFLSLAIMLGSAKVFGQIFLRFKLPSVIGEILAGIFLGPTILGRIMPEAYNYLFPAGKESTHVALESFILIGVVFLLLVAGLEVELTSVLKQGKSVIIVSSMSIIFPFILGASVATAFPYLFGKGDNRLALAAFIGISLSVTALPIIARILLNMKLFHSDFGMLIMAAAIINDMTGWLLFSVIIQMLETGSVDPVFILKTVMITVLVTGLILTVLKSLINKVLPWVQANSEWPGGPITFTIVLGLVLSALTEALGIHAIFGAFLAGIAIGDSHHLREQTRGIINQFIDNIFAPLFFVSIGLRTDFVHNFNPLLALLFISIVFAGKLGGSLIAGKISGLKTRESLSIGSGMSASGAMGIILGLFALQYGLINDSTFEAIVIMAIFTSLASGPLMKYFLKPEQKLNILELIEQKYYIQDLFAVDAADAIRKMAYSLENKTELNHNDIAGAVIEREDIMSTGIGNEIAVPHARLTGITRPYLVIAKSESGIDFNAIDGKLAHLLFMILTPFNDQQSQIQILSDISTIFHDKNTRDRALQAKSYSEFISSIKPVIL